MYKVNENAPELLNVQGRQFLMMGDKGENVSPNADGGGTINYVFNGQTNRNELIAAVQTARALSRNASVEARRRGAIA